MADNVTFQSATPATPPSATVAATDQLADLSHVPFAKIMDGTLDSTNKLIVSAAGAAKVDASGVAVPVTDNAGSLTVDPNTGTVWDVSDRAARLVGVVSGGANVFHVDDNAGSLTVDAPVGTPVFVRLSDGAAALAGQKTMALSIPVALASDQAAIPVSESGTWTVQPGNTQNTTAWRVTQKDDAAALAVTATGIAAAAVTLTLPLVSSQFHYITEIQIVKFATALLTAAATPVLVTTTNLPGSPVFSFSAAASAQGTSEVQQFEPNSPLKSSVAGTATTIVCPATTATIWRVNVFYYAAT